MHEKTMNACVKAENDLMKAKEMIDNGMELTSQMKADVVHEYEFCMILKNDNFWEDLRLRMNHSKEKAKTSHHEPKNDTHVNVVGSDDKKYNHIHEDCDIDKEMKRIIDTGTTEMMVKLSAVLSEHFEDLEQIQPRMYTKLLEEMKTIKY